MYQTGLLLLTGPIRIVVESIAHYLNFAKNSVSKRLYVKLEPDLYSPFTKSDTKHLASLSTAAPTLYRKASTLCENLDVRLLVPCDLKRNRSSSEKPKNFDVIFTNSTEDSNNISQYVGKEFQRNNCSVIKVDNIFVEELSQEQIVLPDFNVYAATCLGGTFDRLHNGHKVLLTEAVLRATERLVVGVTDKPMLEKKVLWELINPVQQRIDDVLNFLHDVDSSLTYDVVPITDPYGPTVVDPDIDCIIVSEETKAGGEKVNIERSKKGFSKLFMHTIDLVENTSHAPEEETKLSSTTNRMHLLGTLLSEPQITLPYMPYKILLRGCSTCDKSVVDSLKDLSTSIICYDEIIKSVLMSNDSYVKQIQLDFGNDVFTGGLLDYKKFWVTCLKDKDEPDWLSDEMCKIITIRVNDKIKEYVSNGECVVFIKESDLMKVHLHEFHELWVNILPYPEMVKRLMLDYDVTENAAANVISSLPSNEIYVQKANVVFCDLWSIDVTKKQVEKAWSRLRSCLNT